MKKKAYAIVGCVIALIVIGIVIAVAMKGSGQNAEGVSDALTEESGTANIDGDFDDFEYAEGIGGFYSDYDSESQQEIYGLTLPYGDEINNFQILNIGRYTGGFFEDGSDERVANVLAILVKNTGDSMFEFLELRFADDDGNEYIFDISTLQPGKKCLVLESNQTVYDDGVNLSLQEIIPVYKEDVDMMTDEISFSVEYSNDSAAAEITVTNIGERDIDTVYLCYKTVENGIYIGGITYRTTFEGLAPGESLSNVVSHFYEGSSNIVMIEEGD